MLTLLHMCWSIWKCSGFKRCCWAKTDQHYAAKMDKHCASQNGLSVLPLEICWPIHKYVDCNSIFISTLIVTLYWAYYTCVDLYENIAFWRDVAEPKWYFLTFYLWEREIKPRSFTCLIWRIHRSNHPITVSFVLFHQAKTFHMSCWEKPLLAQVAQISLLVLDGPTLRRNPSRPWSLSKRHTTRHATTSATAGPLLGAPSWLCRAWLRREDPPGCFTWRARNHDRSPANGVQPERALHATNSATAGPLAGAPARLRVAPLRGSARVLHLAGKKSRQKSGDGDSAWASAARHGGRGHECWIEIRSTRDALHFIRDQHMCIKCNI